MDIWLGIVIVIIVVPAVSLYVRRITKNRPPQAAVVVFEIGDRLATACGRCGNEVSPDEDKCPECDSLLVWNEPAYRVWGRNHMAGG